MKRFFNIFAVIAATIILMAMAGTAYAAEIFNDPERVWLCEPGEAPGADEAAADYITISDAPAAVQDGFKYLPEIPLTETEQRLIHDAWTAAGYEYSLALAFADKETNGKFNKDAINHGTHDYGLFQLNRNSWLRKFRKLYGIETMEDMMDLRLNIQGALYVYGDCVRMYGQTERAIAAYNLGPTKKTSTEYSRDVLSRQAKWAARLEEK